MSRGKARGTETLMSLLRQIIGEEGVSIDYESFEGYEVPPRTQFAMLKKPAVSIKNGKLNFNMACIRLFEGIRYVVPLLNRKTHKFAIIPCKEEENSSVEWARQKSDGSLVNKDVTARDFVSKIITLLGWDESCRYKIMGRIANSDRGLILVFDLDEAMRFESVKGPVDRKTGKAKTTRIKYYPEKYKDRIGRDYSDYAELRKKEKYERLNNYSGEEPQERIVAVSEIPAGIVSPILKEAADEEKQQELPGIVEKDA